MNDEEGTAGLRNDDADKYAERFPRVCELNGRDLSRDVRCCGLGWHASSVRESGVENRDPCVKRAGKEDADAPLTLELGRAFEYSVDPRERGLGRGRTPLGKYECAQEEYEGNPWARANHSGA
jgi:hypothetical protein